jgi:beta-lactamase regulating signal transducer with metallopeptidase domain/biopolymer transport protein ExbD
MNEFIQRLNEFSPLWAGALWRATWQGGLTIAGAWVLCRLWPRIPARVRCWLWRLAFAKLLVCFFWATPINLALLPASKPTATTATEAGQIPISPSADSPAPVEWLPSSLNQKDPARIAKPSVTTAVLVLWTLGVMAGVVGLAWRGWRVWRQLRESHLVDQDAIKADLIALLAQFGIRSRPKLRIADGLNTPLLAGWLRPTILLPESFLEDRSATQLRMMLAHELAHIKRHDLWWAWLPMAARVLFFFHPLVFLASKESRLTEEMAADELTVTAGRFPPVDYAGMLVEVAAELFPSPKEEMVIGVVGSRHTLKRRLIAMKNTCSMSNRRMIAAVTIIAAVGLGIIVPWRLTAQAPSPPPPGTTATGAPVQTEPTGATPSAQTGAAPTGQLQLELVSEPKDKAEVLVDAAGHYHYAGGELNLDQLVSELKTASAQGNQSGVRIQFDAKAPWPQAVALFDKLREAGISRVLITTRSDAPTGRQIFNIDFGVWRPNESRQTGAAAAGHEGDYWNAVGVPSNDDHTEADLKFASGEPSPIQVRMVNLGGGWSNAGLMGVKAPMLDTYNYPAGNQGGNSDVVLNGVPAGKYDFYIYGHTRGPVGYGDYTLIVGTHHYGRKTTSNKSDAIENATWVEGSQYVRFAGIKVAAGDKVEILIRPGGSLDLDGEANDIAPPAAAISAAAVRLRYITPPAAGRQPAARTWSDTTICGLQLVPAN